MHRMVCLGWKNEARDLIFIHTESQDMDEQQATAGAVNSHHYSHSSHNALPYPTCIFTVSEVVMTAPCV